MWNQINLFGQRLELNRKSDNPLEGICCEPCFNATEEKCNCRCHGAYHGLGRLNKRDPNDKELPEKEAQEFRRHYTRINCHCGYDLKDEPISYYVPHEAGWTIEGETEKAWLFVHCPKCGYDMSIWKMGVPRE